MGTFTVIPQSTFEEMQLDAGVLLKNFDPSNIAAPDDEDIITATTGGVQITCEPSFSDLFEDVDNAPDNTKEGKHLDGWKCSLSTTALGTSPELIKFALGCADIDGTNTSKIVPRADLQQSDFTSSIWWVGDRADGGVVAVELKNALSTSGFSLQTSKNGKGQTAVTIEGHVSINAQKTVPMEFYSIDPEDAQTVTYTYTAVSSPTGNPSALGYFVLVGDSYRPTSDTTVDSNVTYYTRSETT